MRPKTQNNALNWLIDKAYESSDGILVFSRRTIPRRMYTEISEHVRNLETDLKEIQPRFYNWVESGYWFEFRPVIHKRRKSRARYENDRVEIHFECGAYEE